MTNSSYDIRGPGLDQSFVAGSIFTSAKYSSVSRATDTTIVITELIGCDLSFFIAHRGVGTTLTGNATAADDQSVKVDPATGTVTFLSPFSGDQVEILWFDYKTGGTIIPPGNGGFPITFQFTFTN